MTDYWTLFPTPRPLARVRLFCFPHAGVGPAVYRDWGRTLPPEIEVCGVQLPGRGNRYRDRPFTSMAPLADAAAEALAGHLDLPFALFGHSLGALVAFEVARALRRREALQPLHLFVSGRRGPRLPEAESPVRHLEDTLFIEEVQRRYGGIPAAVLQEPDILQLTVPALRADFSVLETYAYVSEPPLECPITALAGADDHRARSEDLAPWRDETGGRFAIRTFPGRHFYLEDARGSVLERVAIELSAPKAAAAEGARQ